VNRPPSSDPAPPARSEPLLPNAVMAMLIFVGVEVMTFGGFISAYVIGKAQYTVWPPPNQPRLPVETTAVTTLILLISGVLVYIAGRKFAQSAASAQLWLLLSTLLGVFFVSVQGYEWTQLIFAAQPLTMTGNQYGSFFYMIIGAHAVHAVAAILTLTYLYVLGLRQQLTGSALWAGQIFWYFVVGIWPLLYLLVYDPFSLFSTVLT
jgi:heme/copper-type cytochrome/quinol oxidase subunit 3